MTTTALALLNRPSLEAPPHREGAEPFELVDPGAPHVRILDLGVTRGDGAFETISIGNGRPQALRAHLVRFAKSAAALELPAPDLDAWETAVRAAAVAIDPVPEAYVKTIITRGIEGDGRPTGWAYAAPADDFTAARRDGIRVVLDSPFWKTSYGHALITAGQLRSRRTGSRCSARLGRARPR